MNIEDQVVSLKLARKLKDLGIDTKTLFSWQIGLDKIPVLNISFMGELDSEDFPAYNAQELLELLKGAFINIQYSTPLKGKLSVYYQPENGTDNSYSFIGENMANLLAQVLIAQINEGEFKN